VKGSIGFGFPLVATPLLALVVDVKTAFAITIVPNIVMDTIQVARRGRVLATIGRLAVVTGFSVVGAALGTRLLVVLSERIAMTVLGAFALVFVASSFARTVPRLPARWERPLAPVVGLAAGLLTGLTNVTGTPLLIYFQALGMDKQEFVRSIALVFIAAKLTQLAATGWYGVLTGRLLLASVGLTAVGLVGFAAGLRFQDRLVERTFRRLVLGFLALIGGWLVLRGFSSW